MDEITQLTHQGGVGVVAVYALQFLKSRDWPGFRWINNNSANVNRIVGICIALGTSAGFKLAASTGAGGGYDLHIPPLSVVMDMLTDAAAQFAGQQILYHTAVKDTIGGMRTKEMEQGVVRGAVAQVAIGETKTEKKEGE